MITDFFIRQWLAFSKWKKAAVENCISHIAVFLNLLFMGRLRPLLLIGPLALFLLVFLALTWPKWVPTNLPSLPAISFFSNGAPSATPRATAASVVASQTPGSPSVGFVGPVKEPVVENYQFVPNPFYTAGALNTTAFDFPIVLKKQLYPAYTGRTFSTKAGHSRSKGKTIFKQAKKRKFNQIITAKAHKPRVFEPGESDQPTAAVRAISLVWASYCDVTQDQNKCLAN